MARLIACFGVLVGCCGVQALLADDPPATPKVNVEFRWAEFKPVPGVTQEKGEQFGEGENDGGRGETIVPSYDGHATSG
jgi:hypothetical protein